MPIDVAGLRQVAAVHEMSETEIGDPEVAARLDQQVCRLDVTVQDSQRREHGPGPQPPATPGAPLLEAP